MPSSIFTTISIVLLVVPFMIGGFFVQANLISRGSHFFKKKDLTGQMSGFRTFMINDPKK